MKKDKFFIYTLVTLFVVYVVVDLFTPEAIRWDVTFGPQDKNPFGSYILNERSSDIFDEFDLNYQTISELESEATNIFILADYAEVTGNDVEALMRLVEDGGNVFIGAISYHISLIDTLDFDVQFNYLPINQEIFEVEDKRVTIRGKDYNYPHSLVSNYFDLDDDNDWTIEATTEEGPLVISKNIGEGKIILCSTPYLFTNFGMLINGNDQATASLLSLLPQNEVHYTRFYHVGRMEASTPFRYFLSVPALRWSLYLGLLLVILFLVITSWRKQRAIPIIRPPENTTVEYVKTLGALFFRERNHKKAAVKLINHFLHRIREQYFLQVDYSEKFYQQLAAKSSINLEHVIRTFELIQETKSRPQIEEKILIDLSKKIEKFNE